MDAVVSRTPIRWGAGTTGRRTSRPRRRSDPALSAPCRRLANRSQGRNGRRAPSVRLVRESRVVAEATEDLHLIRFESRLHPEGASGPTLAGEAVTDGDRERIARDFQTKLPAVTGGISGGHRRDNLAHGRSPLLPTPSEPRRRPVLERDREETLDHGVNLLGHLELVEMASAHGHPEVGVRLQRLQA